MKHTSKEEKRQALITGKVVSVEPLADKLKRDAEAMMYLTKPPKAVPRDVLGSAERNSARKFAVVQKCKAPNACL
jgi:hypothetical protein